VVRSGSLIQKTRYDRATSIYSLNMTHPCTPIFRSVRWLRGCAIGLLLAAALTGGDAVAQRMYDSSGSPLGRVDGERYYDSSGRQIGRVDGTRIYDASGRQLGRIDGDRIYDASGTQIGRIDGERLYSGSGTSMGRIDGERIYDASGRQIGRADGLRRMQIVVYFFFFM
jgi:hypothetical protein